MPQTNLSNGRLWRWSDSLLPWLLPTGVFLVWQLVAMTGSVSRKMFPAPTDVIQTFVNLLANGELAAHFTISFQRAIAGFAIGGGIGFILGLNQAYFDD